MTAEIQAAKIAHGFNFTELGDALAAFNLVNDGEAVDPDQQRDPQRVQQVVATIMDIRREDFASEVELVGPTILIGPDDNRLNDNYALLPFLRVTTGLSESAVSFYFRSNQGSLET